MNFNRLTWFILIIGALCCIPITIHFFPMGFPIISLNITMNRAQALERAREIAEKYHLVPTEFQQAALFHVDDRTKTYIELDGGGKNALVSIMDEQLYMPYLWIVRNFQPGDPRTTLIMFKPDGTPHGFKQHFSENDAGENLTADYARVIAETQARDIWHIDLTPYTLIETAHETQPSGRVDHLFVYERTNLTIGSGGKYRLRLGVSGDQFSTLMHEIYIPETFTRHYEEMRSANDAIANAARHWYHLFYFLGGCVLALLWLARARWLILRTPMIWAVIIAFLLALSRLNQLPTIWITYDTALPAQGFLLNYLAKTLDELVHAILPLALGFIAAESLSRKAFGNQPQLWRVWNGKIAASTAIAGATLGAYILVFYDFAFASIFYAFTTAYHHWWVPSSQFFDPNILAMYLPWLTPCIEALEAGFREECLFRAIPLAGAALIGERIGKRNLMITLAFIMQAIVFSAIHADYPGQPAYARLVELLAPSCMYAYIYLRYGLLPVIITHTLYDIVWMALPLFISHAPYAWVHQLMVLIIASIPALIVLYAYMTYGKWTTLTDAYRNRGWKAPTAASLFPALNTLKSISQVLSPLIRNLLLLSGLVGIPLWLYTTNFCNDAHPLHTQRHEALAYAHSYAQAHGMQGSHWYPLITVQNVHDDMEPEHRFVWQHTDPKTYQSLLNTYLIQPRWLIRFLNMEPNLIARTEEYRVGIQDNGAIHGFYHVFPEPTPGASLDIEQARTRAQEIITQETNIDPNALIEREASPLKLPARTDWHFILSDPEHYPLAQGQGRMLLYLAGDLFSRLSWTVHVPEAWERLDRSLENKIHIIDTICSMLLYLLTLCALYAMVHTHRFPLNFSILRSLFGFFLFMEILNLFFTWPDLLGNIKTSEPFYYQLFTILGIKGLRSLMRAGALSSLIVSVTNLQYRYSLSPMPYANFCAVSLGTFIAGILSWVQLLKPSLKPHWANYTALTSLAPTTTTMINALLEFFTMGIAFGILYALIDYVTNSGNRNYLLSMLIALLFALSIPPRQPILSISGWLFESFIMAIMLIAAYYLLLRFHRALLPLVILPIIVGEYIQQAALNAFTESIPINLLAAAYCIIAAFLWSYSFTLEPEKP